MTFLLKLFVSMRNECLNVDTGLDKFIFREIHGK